MSRWPIDTAIRSASDSLCAAASSTRVVVTQPFGARPCADLRNVAGSCRPVPVQWTGLPYLADWLVGWLVGWLGFHSAVSFESDQPTNQVKPVHHTGLVGMPVVAPQLGACRPKPHSNLIVLYEVLCHAWHEVSPCARGLFAPIQRRIKAVACPQIRLEDAWSCCQKHPVTCSPPVHPTCQLS